MGLKNTMKTSGFLVKLHKEGKLEIVDPSDNICESYLHKSESHFDSAKILFTSEKLEECISMAYYGMYHSLVALLFKCGIKSENHTASILLLKALFNEDSLAKDFNFAKKERIDKQYYTDFKITKADSKDMINKAENSIIKIKLIIKRLDKEKINQLRDTLNKSLPK